MKRNLLRIVIPAYPAFNIYTFVADKTSSLGPVYVASSAREVEGWDVEVIDENNLRRYGPRSKSGGADHEFLQRIRPANVVGLYGGLTSTIPRLYEIARFYKTKGIVTIAGGQHFCTDTIPEALSSGIDYVAIGEGEETIKEFLLAIEGNQDFSNIKGLAYLRNGEIIRTPKREHITDFDKLPLADFSLVRYAKIKHYPVERIRGCGMDCEFCTVKGKPRCASPERLLESISLLLETKNAKHFFIVDDLFGQQRDETIRFCKMLKDYQEGIGKRLDLMVQIRLDKAKDPELLTAMRQAGINSVAIGFESPIEEELVAMRKHLKPEEMINLTRIFHRFGFLIHGMFVFGYPLKEGAKSTVSLEERIKRMREFIKKAKIDTVQVLLPVPLPGTELRERLEKEDRVYPIQDVGWEYYDGNFMLFEPDSPVTAEELQASIKKIMGKFYRFRYMFMIALNIFMFPGLIFFFKHGWKKWRHLWRNNRRRFGGWLVMRGWLAAFRKNKFMEKIQKAKQRIASRRNNYSPS
jgi:radical SAM superfamily enzyme YgiQ (UPF0313 family)